MLMSFHFKKNETLNAVDGVCIEHGAHGASGPLQLSYRQPMLKGTSVFIGAAEKLGHTNLDYNGTNRGGPDGCVSAHQTTMASGFRVDAYSAFLKNQLEVRPNLKMFPNSMATRILLEGTKATGIEYSDGTQTHKLLARKEVILCCGAIQSPQLLQVSGIGPASVLSACGVSCVVDAPVGRGLKDHLMIFMMYDAPGVGLAMMNVGPTLGADALRVNPTQVFDKGPLPANPEEDEKLPEELKQLKAHAEVLVAEYMKTGTGIPASSLYEASVFHSTCKEDLHTHDSQISFMCSGFGRDAWETLFHFDCSKYFEDPQKALAATNENIILAAGLVQPRSEGKIEIQSGDMTKAPKIDCAYLSHPHDMEVLKNSMRQAHKIASQMGVGNNLYVPQNVTKAHAGATPMSDEVLEDWILQYTTTYHHASCTCAIGKVVDPHLKVLGAHNLRVADASVMPNITSGNTQATCYMIGQKAAALLAEDYGLSISDVPGTAKCRCTCM